MKKYLKTHPLPIALLFLPVALTGCGDADPTADKPQVLETPSDDDRLQAEASAAEEQRLAAEKAAEEQRLAAEKAAEEQRLAAERAAAAEMEAKRGEYAQVGDGTVEMDGRTFPACVVHRPTGVEFVFVPGGRFALGLESELLEKYSTQREMGNAIKRLDCAPSVDVLMSGFFMSKHEISYGEYVRGSAQLKSPLSVKDQEMTLKVRDATLAEFGSKASYLDKSVEEILGADDLSRSEKSKILQLLGYTGEANEDGGYDYLLDGEMTLDRLEDEGKRVLDFLGYALFITDVGAYCFKSDTFIPYAPLGGGLDKDFGYLGDKTRFSDVENSVPVNRQLHINRLMGWPRSAVPAPTGNDNDHPVVNIAWYEAREWCVANGYALPSEAQWEYAASGPDNDPIACGEFSGAVSGLVEMVANTVEDPSDVSWCGVVNLTGNCAEWVFDPYLCNAKNGGEDYGDPGYSFDALSLNPVASDPRWQVRVQRGGSHVYQDFVGFSWHRLYADYRSKRPYVSFRAVIAPENMDYLVIE